MYKTKIVQLCDRNLWAGPAYSTVEDEIPGKSSTFTATITVNGLSFQASEKCSSKDEAQNMAAKLAFDQLYTVAGSEQTINPIPDQVPPTIAFSLPSEARYMYKTVLKNYAEKRKMVLPVYSSETGGTSLAKRYKSKVTFGGQVYECQEFYKLAKDAESAAAEIACELLLKNNNIEEEQLFMYKTLLNDSCKKQGLIVNYLTTQLEKNKFTSYAEMGGRSFPEQTADTKKKVEMKAAKVAYIIITQEYELAIQQMSTSKCNLHELLKNASNSGNLANQPTELGSQQTPTTVVVQSQELIVTPSSDLDNSADSIEINPNIHVAELKDVETNLEGSTDSDIKAKKCDTDLENQDIPQVTELPWGLSNCTTKAAESSHPSKDEATVIVLDPLQTKVSSSKQPSVKPFVELKSIGELTSLDFDKLVVYPRIPNMTFPEDGSVVVLPYEHDQWVLGGVTMKKLSGDLTD